MRQVDIVKEEEKTLKFWEENKVFEKTLEATKNGRPFVFFEGPPTANARPGIHHVLSRAFKDVVLRYQTMRGRFVGRRAGWDTHGLPVEIEVEKKLGLKNKKDVEKFGIAEFNRRCQESVWQYKDDWEKMTRRMGFWLDFKDHYATYEPKYIESLWHILKKISAKKLLVKDYKVVPYCARCGTPVSSHEVAQGYETVTDNSVVVKFRVKGQSNAYLLAWTTTPWTLPGNVALAISPKVIYQEIESGGEHFILARDLVEKVFAGKEYTVVKKIKVSELAKLSYEPLFKVKELESSKSYKVYPADFVNTTEGTGLVHTAVMYGADDFELGSKIGLPKFHTVNPEGEFVKSVPVVGGLRIISDGKKDEVTEKAIILYLKKQNLIFAEAPYTHEYPFCWRCKNPLLYYARDSWFIKMSALRQKLITNNSKINWIPEHIKAGRLGEWLREVKDWALSRERYWGTPLPIWECDKCDNRTVVGSLEELNQFRFDKPAELFLMRHGEAHSNINGRSSCWPEKELNPLTEDGKKQVMASAQKLKKEKIDIIYSSDLLRTKETAQIVADELKIKKVVYDERLREINTGIFNGRNISDYQNSFKSFKDKFVNPSPQGESWLDVYNRVKDFVNEISRKHSGKKVLVVSHMDPLFLILTTNGIFGEDEIGLAYDTATSNGNSALNTAEFKKFVPNNWPKDANGNLNLHRPFVDEIYLKCGQCSSKMKRIKDLADVWFDSGAMPWASNKSQISNLKSQKLSKDRFPADYICEAIDQTRGWFYTLLAVSTALGEGAPYKNVICLNHVLDDKGEKMSKSKGNTVDPMMLGEQVGFDALRWYFYSVNAPGDNKLFNLKDVETRQRQLAHTIINSFLFLETYYEKPPASLNPRTNILDRWILERLEDVSYSVGGSLDKYDVTAAARLIENFVDDMSNWYIRRSRRKFQKQNMDGEKLAAQNTLEQVLKELAILLAPFVPFLSEWLYQNLKSLNASGYTPDPKPYLSVHLETYPKVAKPKKSEVLKVMAQARSLVALGLAERARAGIKVRQPLNALYLSAADYACAGDFLDIVAEELNVKKVLSDRKVEKGMVLLDTELTPTLREEGLVRELVRNINAMRKEAHLTPDDKIILYYDIHAGVNFKELLARFEEVIKQETRSSEVVFGISGNESLLIHKTWSHNGYEIGVGIKKIN